MSLPFGPSHLSRPFSPSRLALRRRVVARPQHDVDPTAVDGSGRTPLEVARRAGKDAVIEFLEQIEKEKGSARAYAKSEAEGGGISCTNACSGGDCVIS